MPQNLIIDGCDLSAETINVIIYFDAYRIHWLAERMSPGYYRVTVISYGHDGAMLLNTTTMVH